MHQRSMGNGTWVTALIIVMLMAVATCSTQPAFAADDLDGGYLVGTLQVEKYSDGDQKLTGHIAYVFDMNMAYDLRPAIGWNGRTGDSAEATLAIQLPLQTWKWGDNELRLFTRAFTNAKGGYIMTERAGSLGVAYEGNAVDKISLTAWGDWLNESGRGTDYRFNVGVILHNIKLLGD